jgi:hypothetical protein
MTALSNHPSALSNHPGRPFLEGILGQVPVKVELQAEFRIGLRAWIRVGVVRQVCIQAEDLFGPEGWFRVRIRVRVVGQV